MKQLIFAVVVLMSTTLFAQEKNKSSFENKFSNSGYGVVSTQYSKFNSHGAVFTGAYGGWMIRHKLLIGAGGYWQPWCRVHRCLWRMDDKT
jgi:hypothetical protein